MLVLMTSLLLLLLLLMLVTHLNILCDVDGAVPLYRARAPRASPHTEQAYESGFRGARADTVIIILRHFVFDTCAP